jgi:hypothetical protein
VTATVGTYPFDAAYREIQGRAKAKGMESKDAPGDGLATWSTQRPSSVYVGIRAPTF